ncbi:histidine phosphotransferase family protein [Lutimaribacter sp. EGI FJ00015]|uniref:Histidine phosphotransferase family protein n=1 Tax=Lutimaribacter degradans TaxID=2945989 RepID=A0ACC5ZW16_9RHOB|nr:histidine phosphotransferase family protein [Lutimaribacter sp. EGI FJ00013]MCM2562246.1 histidine phosphotransferase family protein [Lutimaribacter sp. EGI FJ00013]MCO0613401.1 histidine phosphotransferase family protein [Lutimaribacter sp. EGI FJ00015]MCO0636375.1 histidine phosphotransferase family protein [Lutimaribacter sp. EGI FJ00014]
MSKHTAQLAALVGSRICHDLVSPVGAIGNGLELMGMGGQGEAELALVSESLANAQARIRFFRVAFGAASADQPMAETELRGILGDLGKSARQQVEWAVTGDVARSDARLAFLAIMCQESALPFGGRITVTRDGDTWQVAGSGPKVMIDENLWEALGRPGIEVAPSEVQFALLPLLLDEHGKRPRIRIDTDHVIIRF